MEQEVQVIITLSVDARLTKREIKGRMFKRLQEVCMWKDGLTLMGDFKIQEESEIYGE